MKLLRYSKGSEQGHGILAGQEIYPLIHGVYQIGLV